MNENESLLPPFSRVDVTLDALKILPYKYSGVEDGSCKTLDVTE